MESLDESTLYNHTLQCSTCVLTNVIEQIKPIKTYDNFKERSLLLKKDLRNKSGVYCLVNLIHGKYYIGSSINLSARMGNYLNTAYLKNRKNNNMPIIQALLKYGQNNFALLIVEYVEMKDLAIRESYFISTFLPYYNVLKQGYSSIGFKHTEETKILLSDLAKTRQHSKETKALITQALVGENNPFYNKNHSFDSKLRMIEAKSNYPVYIYDSFKTLLVIFPSVKTIAKLINSNHSTIVSYIKNNNLFRGEWYLSNLPYNVADYPLISDWSSKNSKNLIIEIIKNSHIKKAIFVYNTETKGKKTCILKFDGVTHAQKELKISHDIIKKYARLNRPYNNYIFSYERIVE